MKPQPPPTVVLVHGAWHGPWAWDAVAERLASDGREAIAVDLPSAGAETGSLGDLYDDARAVRAAVDAAGGPAVVVAHSYGGLPVTEGLAGCANAAHLVYLASFMLDEGQSLLGLRDGVEPDWWLTSEDGRTLLPAEPRRVFYGDCDPALAARAEAALVPQRKDAFRQQLESVAWRETPSSYVICELDNAIPPAAQERMSARAGAVHRLPSGHSPFLSRPDDVCAIIRTLLDELAPAEQRG